VNKIYFVKQKYETFKELNFMMKEMVSIFPVVTIIGTYSVAINQFMVAIDRKTVEVTNRNP
jgi:hypothetical protein